MEVMHNMTTQYNVVTYGNLTNTNGVLSGFSASNYAKLPTTFNPPQATPWEILLKVKTGETFNGNDTLFRKTKNGYYGIRIQRNGSTGHLFLSISRTGSSEHNTDGITVLQTNTDYWIKVTFNGVGRYEMSLSTDGTTYNLEGYISKASLHNDSTTPTYIGDHDVANDRSWSGTVDLNESYITINSAIWWRGAQNIIKIQLRHDTAANWTTVNPVLLEGEVGIETDTRKQKFGDGTTAWNSLPYDVGSTALQSITSSDVTTALGYTPVNKVGDTMSGSLSFSKTGGGVISLNAIPEGGYSDMQYLMTGGLRVGFVRASNVSATERNLQISVCNNSGSPTSNFLLRCNNDINSCTFPNTTCVDGQWVTSTTSLSTATAVNTYTIDVSAYLPNDGYNYEVLIEARPYRSNSGDAITAIKSDLLTDYMDIGIANSNARQAYNCFSIPVGTGRTIYYQIKDNALNAGYLNARAYRRMGTNS